MADRDHAAFISFLSDEAVFMSEGEALRGKAAIASGWKRFDDGRSPGIPIASMYWTRARSRSAVDRSAIRTASASLRSTRSGAGSLAAPGRSSSTKAVRRATAVEHQRAHQSQSNGTEMHGGSSRQ